MEKLVGKINDIIESGWSCQVSSQYQNWLSRVNMFLKIAISSEVAEKFLSLGPDRFSSWESSLPSQIGYLEGLVLKAESNIIRSKTMDTQDSSSNQAALTKTNKVFIVHGHDAETKESVARFIEKLKLAPIILHEQANSGKTIIEKFEVFSDVGFAVVLLTPDDVGGSKDNSNSINDRARQNVIMELGYFLGKLGRQRVCALYKAGVEIPSDYQGVVYTEIDKSGAWKTKLAQELVEAGFSINLQALIGK